MVVQVNAGMLLKLITLGLMLVDHLLALPLHIKVACLQRIAHLLEDILVDTQLPEQIDKLLF